MWENYQNERIRLCEKILRKHLAIVSIMFDKETYVRTNTSLRVSFTDKLAAFGKFSLIHNNIIDTFCYFTKQNINHQNNSTIYLHRRNFGTVYWNEHLEYDWSYLLAFQDFQPGCKTFAGLETEKNLTWLHDHQCFSSLKNSN